MKINRTSQSSQWAARRSAAKLADPRRGQHTGDAPQPETIEACQHWLLSTLQPGAEPITDPMVTGAGGTQCYKLAREAIERLFDVCPTDEIRLDWAIQRQVLPANLGRFVDGIS